MIRSLSLLLLVVLICKNVWGFISNIPEATSSQQRITPLHRRSRSSTILFYFSEDTAATPLTQNESLLLRPPEPLLSLPVGQCWKPFENTPTEIWRVASTPDVFVIRNLMPYEEYRKAIVDAASDFGLVYATTAKGVDTARENSNLCWLPSTTFSQLDVNEAISPGIQVACDLTQLAAYLFLMDATYSAEDLQVVRYNSKGRFDMHHDGFGRVVTCLLYLNGVAGTWFPYAETFPKEGELYNQPQANLEDLRIGQDGLWIAGLEADQTVLESSNPQNVVTVNAGDAVVFYNYEWQNNRAIPAWKSEHIGLETDIEKWIATTWFRTNLVQDSEFSNEEWKTYYQFNQ